MMLEECGIPYRVKYVNIGSGEQFAADLLKVSPNNRMPAIVDDAAADGGAPISIFESGAILEYLAEKSGKFLPREPRGKYEVECRWKDRPFLAGDYSIADMAAFPWIVPQTARPEAGGLSEPEGLVRDHP